MERSKDWMDQAEGDLEHARSDLERGFYDWSCFSSQQAAEMAVKAVFQRMGAEAWGHSVADLLQELAKREQVPEELVDVALELDKEGIVKLLSERLKELAARLSLVRVVLFGSYARGNYTVASDVDILIVYRGRRRDDAFAIVKKVFNIPRLEPHLYTEKEYEDMKRTLGKMTKDGVLLFPRAEEG